MNDKFYLKPCLNCLADTDFRKQSARKEIFEKQEMKSSNFESILEKKFPK
jgi:hypothetical protein